MSSPTTEILVAYVCYEYPHRILFSANILSHPSYTHRHPKEAAFWAACDKAFTYSEMDLTTCLPEEYSFNGFHFFIMKKKPE